LFDTMQPAPSLSFGIVNGRAVFMDLSDDSYFLIDDEAEADFLNLLKNGRRRSREHALALGQGIGEAAQAHCNLPPRSLLDEAGRTRSAPLRDIARITLILLKTRRALARVPIAKIIGAPPRPQRSAARLPAPDIEKATLFLAARRLAPIAPNCLLDSLALLDWLGAVAEGCSLVFGVKLDPFAAHCWVQNDNLILNDRAEFVSLFTPVRVV
jgi:hypothetical protein